MRKYFKIFFAIMLFTTWIFTLTGCQEDVFPEVDAKNVNEISVKDQQSETDGDKDDRGVKPR